MADISVDVISFIKENTEIMDLHYPNRVKRLVIVNAPFWFSSVWGMVASVLPEAVKKKIRIIADPKGLDDVIDPQERPTAYGGTGGAELGQWSGHLAFLAMAASWPQALPDTIASVDTDTYSQELKEEAMEREEEPSSPSWFSVFSNKRNDQAYLGEKNQYMTYPFTLFCP